MASAQDHTPSVKFELSPRSKLYLKISESLSEDQVKGLRAMLITDHHIGKGKIETATPHEIFNMLEEDRKIGEGKLGLLIELLKALGKTQMAQELEKEESMKLATMSKRKAPEDGSSPKQPRMSCKSGGSDDSDSSESGIGWSTSSLSPANMETDAFDDGENLSASSEGKATATPFATVGDVCKRIEQLQTKIAELTKAPNSISKSKAKERSKAYKELDSLFKLLEEQSTGELRVDIALYDPEKQEEFQEICETTTLNQEIGEEVKQIIRSTCDDIVDVTAGVKVEFSSNTNESTNCSPGRRATIKVTAEHVEFADSCKLDKDSAVRRLFKYLVVNSHNLRPILTYLNSFVVQVTKISYGSIDFECLCLTPESAIRLQEEYEGKKLQAEIQRVISSLAILAEFDIKSICLAVQLKFASEGMTLGPVSRVTSNIVDSDCDEGVGNIKEPSSPGTDCTVEDQDDIVPARVKRSSGSSRLFGPVDNEGAIESLQSQLAQMEVDPQHKRQLDKSAYPTPEKRLGDMSGGLHSKHGFEVEELKPIKGGKAVKGSSIPLILPNDLKYNASTGRVEKVTGAQRATFHVVPEALELLEGIEEPVSVISICGPCRTGKSYILSRLLGTADAFELGRRMDPQTFGIWMGTKVLRGKDFTIVLLDTEGIDAAAASAGQDAGILVMTILLSSKLIYNSQNVPRQGDLEKMKCFMNLAEGISVKQGQRADASAFREFFPEFLWLLRDVTLTMEDENGKKMDPTEYLKTKVLRRQVENAPTSDEVGQAILSFFSSVECATLGPPTGDTNIMNNIAQHTDLLNSEFNKSVDELTERLLLKARAKRGFCKDSIVNGEALSIMTRQYVKAVNDPNSIPALDNTWKNTIELMQNRAIEEAVMEYKHQMQLQVANANRYGQVPLEETTSFERSPSSPFCDRRRARGYRTQYAATPLYHSQPTLIDLHNQQFEEVKGMLLERVGHLGTSAGDRETVVHRLEQRLVQRETCTEYGAIRKRKSLEITGGEFFHFIQQNREISMKFCQNLSEHLLDPIRKRVDSPPTEYNSIQLTMELRHAREQYEKQARGPQKWVVLQEITKTCEQLEADFKRVEEHHMKLMLAQQKTREAERRAKERDEELQQLRQQAQDMPRAQREIVQKLEEQHKKMMEEMGQEAMEQREERYQELLGELLGQIMKMKMEEIVSALNLEMQMMMQQLEIDINKRRMESLREAMDKRPPPAADGCIIS